MPIRPENKKRYPKNWPEISRRIRFDRAKGQCEFMVMALDLQTGRQYQARCGAKNGAPHPRTGSKVVLTVAHLDHTPENCADDNLMAMCQQHHLRYDLEHHAKTRAANKRCKNTGDLLGGNNGNI